MLWPVYGYANEDVVPMEKLTPALVDKRGVGLYAVVDSSAIGIALLKFQCAPTGFAIMYIGLPYGISISSYVFIVLSGDFRNRTSKILNCIEFSILAQFEICSFWAKER